MEKSIVLELQQEALDGNTRVSDLLRKALVVAKKLNISEFENWVKNELRGYKDASNVPKYRQVKGQPKGWNSYLGWQSIYFEDIETAKAISEHGNTQSIAEVENLAKSNNENSFLCMPYSHQRAKAICQAIGETTDVILAISRADVIKIVSATVAID